MHGTKYAVANVKKLLLLQKVGVKIFIKGIYMDPILELKKQIEKVILLLDQRLKDDPDRPILKTLYDRYVRAGEILTNNDDVKK